MRFKKFVSLLLPIVLFTACGAKEDSGYSAAGSTATNPTTSRNLDSGAFPSTEGSIEQAKGVYWGGTLVNANALDLEGPGFRKLFVSRNRPWSSFDMVTIIEEVAQRMRDLYPQGERLQIGDMSNEHGGQAGGHSSHQNGLDADIAYFRKDLKEQSSTLNSFGVNFVTNGVVSSNFDLERNWQFVNELMNSGRIGRMFVDGAIKKKLCEYAEQLNQSTIKKETLRRLRPYTNHADHVHVRITCPTNSPNCVVQDAPPVGSGCEDVMTASADEMSSLDYLEEMAP